MRPGGGKQKGSAFERKISKDLSLWWSCGKRDDIFYRTHSSGARFTKRFLGGKRTVGQAGDIHATDPTGKPLTDLLTIELKCGYGNWDFISLIDGIGKEENTTLFKFLVQAVKNVVLNRHYRFGWLSCCII